MAVNEGKYVLDHSREYYLFDILPVGAPRMVQSDKWKTDANHLDPAKRKRKPVVQYHTFKDALRAQANILKFELGEYFEIVFFLRMPDKCSEKKKERMNGLPCKVKPDIDNAFKAVPDTLMKNTDSVIWKCNIEKRWAYMGSILIFP